MPEPRRIQIAQAVIVMALAVLAGFVATLVVTWNPVPRHDFRPATGVEAPAGEVGSGLHLPLGGER